MTVLEQLQKIVREYTGDGSLHVEEGTLLTAGIGLDSYDMASLLGVVEEHFDVVIPDRAVMDMLTAGDMADYIMKQKDN